MACAVDVGDVQVIDDTTGQAISERDLFDLPETSRPRVKIRHLIFYLSYSFWSAGRFLPLPRALRSPIDPPIERDGDCRRLVAAVVKRPANSVFCTPN